MSDKAEVILCLTPADHAALDVAMAEGRITYGPHEGCVKGLLRVQLDVKTARTLLATLAVALKGFADAK